ncbi:MAG: sigma-54-dependent Fis family transcriptional regulator [Deltaproteobacteria bacterium]|nr:sigma-54-dependent Fis family transcriptional regulator [Deltaproteobacteria bacterium]
MGHTQQKGIKSEETRAGIASILVVEDDPAQRRLLERQIVEQGYYLVSAGSIAEAAAHLADKRFDVALVDVRLPDGSGLDLISRIRSLDGETQVIVMTAHGTMSMAIEALRLGAYDFLPKPYSIEKLRITVKNAVEHRRMSSELHTLRDTVRDRFETKSLIASSPAMGEVMRLVQRVAASSVNVFIHGESGTGKEVIARAIHFGGDRASGPFVAVNCGAIPENLLESELFGHEKGAFTGAVARHTGRFQEANGGTLFLDEIGEMPLSMQVKILRAIQEKEVHPVGASKPVKVEVRIISATHKNLEAECKAGRFREDLYYRLAMFPIALPPLRERLVDLPDLVQLILRKHSRANPYSAREGISPIVMEALRSYPWPGNIRELENVLARACIMANSPVIELGDLPAHFHGLVEGGMATVSAARGPAENTTQSGSREIFAFNKIYSYDTYEEEIFKNALRLARGNITRAARELGIGRVTMYRKMRRYGFSADLDGDDSGMESELVAAGSTAN